MGVCCGKTNTVVEENEVKEVSVNLENMEPFTFSISAFDVKKSIGMFEENMKQLQTIYHHFVRRKLFSLGWKKDEELSREKMDIVIFKMDPSFEDKKEIIEPPSPPTSPASSFSSNPPNAFEERNYGYSKKIQFLVISHVKSDFERVFREHHRRVMQYGFFSIHKESNASSSLETFEMNKKGRQLHLLLSHYTDLSPFLNQKRVENVSLVGMKPIRQKEKKRKHRKPTRRHRSSSSSMSTFDSYLYSFSDCPFQIKESIPNRRNFTRGVNFGKLCGTIICPVVKGCMVIKCVNLTFDPKIKFQERNMAFGFIEEAKQLKKTCESLPTKLFIVD